MAATDGVEPTSSINTTKKTDRSSLMGLLQGLTKPIGPKISAPKKEFPAGSPKLDVHDCAKTDCDVEERVVEDTYIYDFHPRIQSHASTTQTPAKQLYYFAGGSWQMPPSKEHWAFCAEVAKQVIDIRVSIVSCPLAPHSPAPVTMPQLLRCYRRLLQDADAAGQRVLLAGDSSGGEIIICLTTNALADDPNSFAPTALVAICPSIDLRQENPDQSAIEKTDPVLRVASSKQYAETWRGDWEDTDPRINPLFADVKALARANVKVHGVVAGNDILRPDAIKLKEKLEEVGVSGEWLDWDKQMHGYPLTWTYGLSNGKEAKDWILELVRGA